MTTNTVRSKEESPYLSALVNFPRSVAEVVAVWLLDLIQRLRGNLHSERIVDQLGLDRWRSIQGAGVLPQHPPPLRADGSPRAPGSLADFADAVRQQVEILTIADTFRILLVLTFAMMLLVLVLPERTLPPRLLFAERR